MSAVNGLSGECDDGFAERAAALDAALAAGREPLPVPADDPEGLSALLTAWASLQMLERVWPRSVMMEAPEPGSSEPASPSPAPAVFGRFRIIRELGQGGFGVVFLALDPELRRPVALKVPRAGVLLDPESRRRFVREARAAAALDHPNVVPLYEAGDVGPVCYLASAYCEGPSLAAWLRDRHDPVPPRLAAQVVAPLADAMQHAHERGILHRDLKPSNVLFHHPGPAGPGPDARQEREAELASGDQPEFIPRIVDFGLARLMDQVSEERTASFPAMGSAPYMAPEQVEGKKVGPAADVYGLGTILYCMLCRRPPHRGANDPDTLRRVVADEPIPPHRIRPEVPRDLEAVCLKCLEKDPARRYRSARDLADDLGRFLAGAPTKARPVSAPARAWRAVRRRPARLASFALVGAFALAVLVGTRWYEGRLANARRITREKFEVGRRHQYHADIRLAAQFAGNNQTVPARRLLERNRPQPGEIDLREFTWYHLLRRCRNVRLALEGHRGDVYHAEFSPDGRRIATAGKDGTVRLWDPASGRRILTIPAHSTEVNWVAFSPDGHALATTGDDGLVKLWDAGSGDLIWERVAHPDGAEGSFVFFLHDGKTVLSGGRRDPVVKSWDRVSGTELARFRALEPKPPLPNLDGAALSPDGSTLAVVGGSQIALWDVARRVRVASLNGGQSSLQSVAFAHDGTKLVTADEGGRVLIWEWPGGRLLPEFNRQPAGVFAIAFAPDDRFIALSGADPEIRLVDLASGAIREVFLGHTSRVWGLTFGPDAGTMLSAARDGTARLWDVHDPHIRTVLTTSAPSRHFAFSKDGGGLTSISANFVVSTWDLSTGAPRQDRALEVLGATGDPILNADGTIAAVMRKDGVIEIWDLVRWRLRDTIGPIPGLVHLGRFDPSEQILAVQSQRLCNFLDLSNHKIIYKQEEIFHAFSRDGEALLYCHGSTIRLNLVQERAEIIPAFSSGDLDWSLFSFSADGSLLATSQSYGRSVKLWNWKPLEFRSELAGHKGFISTAAFSPDNRTLATGDLIGVVKLWDVASGEELFTLEPQIGGIGQIRFSPDGLTLAVSSFGAKPGDPMTITLWHTSADHTARVTAAGVQPDQSR